jgi:peptidoglycan hydrolase-like protein with peptidoglycan-binding domain
MTRRTRNVLIGGIAAIVVATVVALNLGGGGSSSDGGDDEALEFETVVRRDLTEVTSLDGTLGFPEGESVASRLQGTITSVAPAGAIVDEGDLLFAVSGEPVVLLLGTAPAYRAIGQEPVMGSVNGGTSGTVTAIVEEGAVLEPGTEIARVNDEPLILLPGSLPAWRSLRTGSEGADVQQLETALVALGFDPNGTITVDEYYSSTTAAMVERWQAAVGAEEDGRFGMNDAVFFPDAIVVTDVHTAVGASVGPSSVLLTVQAGREPIEGDDVSQLQDAMVRLGYGAPTSGTFDDATRVAVESWQAAVGAEVDGVVDLGEVVFLPSPVRVTEAVLTVGRPVNDGSSVLATTESSSVILVNLPADDQDLLAVDMEVTVGMPDGSEAAAIVTDISGIATRLSSGEVVFETTIRLLDTTVGADLDQAPVEVIVVTDSRTDVLAVPVTALLALAEGGYAVEVDNGDGTTRLVAVEPGLYADTWVEVSATGLVAGDRVVVP